MQNPPASPAKWPQCTTKWHIFLFSKWCMQNWQFSIKMQHEQTVYIFNYLSLDISYKVSYVFSYNPFIQLNISPEYWGEIKQFGQGYCLSRDLTLKPQLLQCIPELNIKKLDQFATTVYSPVYWICFSPIRKFVKTLFFNGNFSSALGLQACVSGACRCVNKHSVLITPSNNRAGGCI